MNSKKLIEQIFNERESAPDTAWTKISVDIYNASRIKDNTREIVGEASKVQFSYDIQQSQVGLEGIGINIASFNVALSDENTGDTIGTVEINTEQVKKSTKSGGSFAPDHLTLYLNPDLSVNYEATELEITVPTSESEFFKY